MYLMSFRRLKHCTVLVCTVALWAGCGRSAFVVPTTRSANPAGAPNAVVVRVVDGDTVAVRTGPHSDKVRLIGINTPESVKPNTAVQCFALEASARTKALLPPRTAVRLVRDVEARDRYHRLLAYVYRAGDGLFVDLALAREGFARPYTFPPHVAHDAVFVAPA